MKIVCFLLKLVLKILLLPVAFLLRFLCFIWNLLMQLSLDRKSTRLNSSHIEESRMPSSA